MKNEKIDFLYDYLKRREEMNEKHKKNVKVIGLVFFASLFVAILILIYYCALSLMELSTLAFESIESKDIKMAVASLEFFILSLSAIWFGMFGLPQIFPSFKKEAK